MDPEADPLQQIRQGSEASVRFMAAHARSFALMAVENVDRQFVEDIRQGTEVHADDTERLIVAGIDAGLIRDEDPRLLAYSVLTTVGWFAHFHRTGRLDIDVDELAGFVGRQVVCSLAASEEVVRTTRRWTFAGAEPAVHRLSGARQGWGGRRSRRGRWPPRPGLMAPRRRLRGRASARIEAQMATASTTAMTTSDR